MPQKFISERMPEQYGNIINLPKYSGKTLDRFIKENCVNKTLIIQYNK